MFVPHPEDAPISTPRTTAADLEVAELVNDLGRRVCIEVGSETGPSARWAARRQLCRGVPNLPP